jgi:predicted DCC family thiol-disulfide oxidoreductase YuxK
LPSVPPAEKQPETIFYDGHCALCHGTVKFVLRRDASRAAFRFAPLQGETFQSRVPENQRVAAPDSIVVLTRAGSLLVRSDAILHILRGLGGVWRPIARIVAAIPRALRDAGYNFIARIRYRVFGTRDHLCPVVPPELRARFDP